MASSVDNAAAGASPVEIFYSYSHRDEVLRAQLQDSLSPLAREGVAVHWDDRKIDPGEKWGNKINEHLNSADVILLLISRGFVASDYCYVTVGVSVD
jgi:hypothetical protein